MKAHRVRRTVLFTGALLAAAITALSETAPSTSPTEQGTDPRDAVQDAANRFLRGDPRVLAAARQGNAFTIQDVKRLVYGEGPREACYLVRLQPAGYLLFMPRIEGGLALSDTDLKTSVDFAALPDDLRKRLRCAAIEEKLRRKETLAPEVLIEYWTDRFVRAAHTTARRAAASQLLKLEDDGAWALLQALRTVEKSLEQGDPPTVAEVLDKAGKLRSHADLLRAWDVLKPALQTVTTTDPLTSEGIHEGGDTAVSLLRQTIVPNLRRASRRSDMLNRELSRYREQALDHFYKAARKLDAGVDEDITALFSLAGQYEVQRDVLKQAAAAGIPHEDVRAIDELNRLRLMYGVTPLRIDPKLCETARDHCKDMVTRKFFSHESPVEGKKSPWDRARRFGTSAGGENIYFGSADPAAPIRAWYYSPGHHRNEMGARLRFCGIGRCQTHWTLMVR